AVTAAAGLPDSGTPAGRAATAAALVGVVTQIGHASNLVLDPDLDAFSIVDVQVVQLPRALLAAAHAAAPAPGGPRVELVAAQAEHAGTASSAGAAIRDDLATASSHTTLPGLESRTAPAAAVGSAATALAGRLTSSLDHPAAADPTGLATAALAAVGPDAEVLDDLLAARADRLSLDRAVTLGVTVLALLLGVWIAAAVLWRTRHDARLALSAVTAIAEGSHEDHPVPDGQDELGDLGRALGQARRQLARQSSDLERSLLERDQQAERGVAAQRVAEQQVRARAQGVVEETASVVAGGLREVVGQVEAVRGAAGTIAERVTSADAVTKAVVEQAAEADRVVNQLGHSLQRVASMAQLIAGVADQTKLLALNATIEAARAGEAGRGFSVVADEVKNLAMTTARSTEEIASTIASLERDAGAMSATITNMTGGIKDLDEATAVLAEVAGEQHRLVEDLDRCVSGAIARVEDMGSLTERLERRRNQRVGAEGPAWIRLRGRTYEAQLRDVSEGGLRCVGAAAAAALPQGQVAEVEFELDGHRLASTGFVTRFSDPVQRHEVGLEFTQPPAELEAALRAYVQRKSGAAQPVR
ncbi:MAG: methyl-accepting chemotaxis protein, partial [Kineosporiaceae bacterium]